MATSYSALFSSGLLATPIARCTTPVLPSSPMPLTASPVQDPVDRQLNLTPTPLGQTSPCPNALESNTTAEHNKTRRRRSSINVGASPMALIKSPIRSAGAALQRTGFRSPTRHRAGSITMNDALQTNSLYGIFRSGSVGAANPLKRPRRMVHYPAPLAPPPSVPLPALPSSPTVTCGNSLLPPAVLVPMPRQPLTNHSENSGNTFLPTLHPGMLLSPGYAHRLPFKIPQGFPGSYDDMIDEVMAEC